MKDCLLCDCFENNVFNCFRSFSQTSKLLLLSCAPQFDYGDSSAGHEFSSESEDDEVVLGDPELARINAELKAKLPGTYRRDKALLNQVVNYLRSNYKFEIKQTRRRQLRFHNCIPRKQVFENVRKNCSGVIEHRFFSSSNFGKLFKIVFPGCISKTTGTGYKKVNSYLNLVQV